MRDQAKSKNWSNRLLAVIQSESSRNGKSYRTPIVDDELAYQMASTRLEEIPPDELSGLIPDEPMQGWKREIRPPLYGIETWGEIFNARQKYALSNLITIIRSIEGYTSIHEEEYVNALITYFAIIVDRLTDKVSMLVTYEPDREKVSHTYTRQALPMIWDYCEASVLTDIGLPNATDWVVRVIENSTNCSRQPAQAIRGTATKLPFDDNFLDAIITDPPYYDAISYAELSDYFYVWLKRTVGHIYPEHFRTPLTPKAQEAVQNPSRHGGDNAKAKYFFEKTMYSAFKEMHRVIKPSGEATIVFAHKSTDAWETLISALIAAGFRVEASWPIKTEMASKMSANEGRTMLASSTFLNCTKRTSGGVGYFNDVRRDMIAAIQPQLAEFWASGIRGADFFMSAIGPGLEAYSRHDEVRRVSGEVVSVGEFLDEVRKIVMEFALEQVLGAKSLGAVDAPTQFALLSLWGYGAELPSDEARKLAQSVGVELDDIAGLVNVKGEKAAVLGLKARAKDKHLGLSRHGEKVPMVDAMHKAVTLLGGGSRQAVSDYLGAVGYLPEEAFWQTMQALAEVQEGVDDGRALHELLTICDNLPKPSADAVEMLFGGQG